MKAADTPMNPLMITTMSSNIARWGRFAVICAFVVTASAATNSTGVQPQWTCPINQPITFYNRPTDKWDIDGVWMSDSVGNCAIMVYQKDAPYYINILWISSQGVLLASIKTTVREGRGITPYFVSGSSIVTLGQDDLDPTGEPYQYVKYTLNKGVVVRTPLISQNLSVGIGYGRQGFGGMLGMTGTNSAGRPNGFVFYSLK